MSTRRMEATADETTDEPTQATGYQRESWYLANIPRDVVVDLLSKSEEGAFFVRDSQSQPGNFALTMRVPYDSNQSGIGNYLIVQQQIGIMIKGFDSIFPDLPTLIRYHSEQADGLPCKLALSKSNPFMDSDEEDSNPYENFEEPADPDYINLSNFLGIQDELMKNS